MKISNYSFIHAILTISLTLPLIYTTVKFKVNTGNFHFPPKSSPIFIHYNYSLTNKANSGYDSNIFIGYINAVFNMEFDTATPWIWIPSSSTDDDKFSNKYNCSESITCNIDSNNEEIYIHPQGIIKGYQVTDTINFPTGYSLDQNSLTLSMSFILATHIDPIFDEICTGDGVFGLGLGETGSKQSIVDVLYNENLIQSRWFSLFLNNDPYYSDSLSELIIKGMMQVMSKKTRDLRIYRLRIPQYGQ